MARVSEHGVDLPVRRVCPADAPATFSFTQYRQRGVHQKERSLLG